MNGIEPTLLSTTAFALGFLLTFYTIICIAKREIIRPHIQTLFCYVTIFSLFGVVGEVFVNTMYTSIVGSPLWEYQLFPAHGGSISYFFLFVWGSLGVYKYFTDYLFSQYEFYKRYPGLIMGGEAVFLELVYNGLYLLIFGSYIFYYLPGNLGPLSHLSCLQVIPFYFIVGHITHKLITIHNQQAFSRSLYATYWLIIITFVFL
jgi:hypothetical protein